MRGCKIEGCEREHYARDRCRPHYLQLPDVAAKNRERVARAANRERKRERDARPENLEKHRRAEAARRERPGVRDAVNAWFRSPRGRESGRVRANRRRARKRAVRATLTLAQWLRILSAWSRSCAYCCKAFQPGDWITQDHIDPISRAGTHDPWNVVPCCRTCNSSKRDRSLSAWLAPREYRAFVDRWARLAPVTIS